jgi:FkbM family methyltransferase
MARSRAKWIVDGVGLGKPSRWLWNRRPGMGPHRRFQQWLRDKDAQDMALMRSVLSRTVGERDNCIDIGAATGDFLFEIYRYAPHGDHIAYEPLPIQRAVLQERFPAANVREVAVSNVRGETTFVQVDNAPGWSGLRAYEFAIGAKARVTELLVRTVRLDDDLPPGYVPKLIKIDVNGAEEMVFRGAIGTIAQYQPTILFEHGLAAEAYGTSSATLHSLITEECRLRIFTLEGSGPLSPDELSASTEWNFIAR